MPGAIVVLTDGFEETEALATVDLLRRAKIETTLASITGGLEITGRSGIRVIADKSFRVDDMADAIILPGGSVVASYEKSEALAKAVKAHFAAGKLVCAICAAPLYLFELGLLGGKRVTCYPGASDDMKADDKSLRGVEVSAEPMETCDTEVGGKIITSKGPATVFKFGLAIIEALIGVEAANTVAQGFLFADR